MKYESFPSLAFMRCEISTVGHVCLGQLFLRFSKKKKARSKELCDEVKKSNSSDFKHNLKTVIQLRMKMNYVYEKTQLLHYLYQLMEHLQ